MQTASRRTLLLGGGWEQWVLNSHPERFKQMGDKFWET